MRGTQSLVHICAACWKRPSLLGWELLWRWGFGIPAAACSTFRRPGSQPSLLLTSPDFRSAIRCKPGSNWRGGRGPRTRVARAALWLGPLLAVAWAIASGLGRSALLQRLDPALQPASVTLILLQLLRIAALVAVCLGWYSALRWAANTTLISASPTSLATAPGSSAFRSASLSCGRC